MTSRHPPHLGSHCAIPSTISDPRHDGEPMELDHSGGSNPPSPEPMEVGCSPQSDSEEPSKSEVKASQITEIKKEESKTKDDAAKEMAEALDSRENEDDTEPIFESRDEWECAEDFKDEHRRDNEGPSSTMAGNIDRADRPDRDQIVCDRRKGENRKPDGMNQMNTRSNLEKGEPLQKRGQQQPQQHLTQPGKGKRSVAKRSSDNDHSDDGAINKNNNRENYSNNDDDNNFLKITKMIPGLNSENLKVVQEYIEDRLFRQDKQDH